MKTNLMNTIKIRTILKYIYICYPLLSNVIHCRRCENSQQKLYKIYTVKNLQNFFMAWKKEMQYVGLLKSC